MDDDLMSLRSGSSTPSSGGSDDDDLFASFSEPAPASSGAPSKDDLGLGLEGFDAPAPAPKAAAPKKSAKPTPKKKPVKKRASGGGFMGLSPQERMLLSIFLFMDVAVMGCLILFAVGAIGR